MYFRITIGKLEEIEALLDAGRKVQAIREFRGKGPIQVGLKTTKRAVEAIADGNYRKSKAHGDILFVYV